MGFAAVVHDDERRSFLDRDCVGFKIPVRVRSARSGLGEQVIESSGEAQRDILAEVRSVEFGLFIITVGDGSFQVKALPSRLD
jgi:hypothetical protein